LPALPLFHTCEAIDFRSILLTAHLQPIEQHNYAKEKLLFFFYGKPSFRPGSTEGSTSFHSFLPCCLVFPIDALPNLHAIYPFVTGDFKKRLFSAFLHNRMAIDHFCLGTARRNITDYVEYFFRDNYSYFHGDVKPVLSDLKSMAFEIEHLFEIARYRGLTGYDDRGATIEIQTTETVYLNEHTAEAIIIPGVFLDDPTVLKFIEKNSQITIYPYKIHRGRTAEYHSEIRRLASLHIFGG
jgi:hypothetical protein